MLQWLGKYDKAREFKEKALAVNIEIGDVNEEAANYGSQGALLQSLCKYIKAREYQEKALAIKIEMGNRK